MQITAGLAFDSSQQGVSQAFRKESHAGRRRKTLSQHGSCSKQIFSANVRFASSSVTVREQRRESEPCFMCVIVLRVRENKGYSSAEHRNPGRLKGRPAKSQECRYVDVQLPLDLWVNWKSTMKERKQNAGTPPKPSFFRGERRVWPLCLCSFPLHAPPLSMSQFLSAGGRKRYICTC